MIAAEAALAASGTATLELGLAETPTVLAYKVNPITAAIVRRLIRTPYAGLVNILQQREVMPEFLQERCRPELITPALLRLLTEPGAPPAQIDACRAGAGARGLRVLFLPWWPGARADSTLHLFQPYQCHIEKCMTQEESEHE
jgi:hypothetical protein